MPFRARRRIFCCMRQLARLGTLVTLLALGANVGCSKDESKAKDTTPNTTKTEVAVAAETKKVEEAKNVAGMAKETVLALKFHHDF